MIKRRALRKLGRRAHIPAAVCVALAVGGIILLRAPGHAVFQDTGTTGTWDARGASQASFEGPALSGHVSFAQGAVVANGARRVLAELRLAAGTDAPGQKQRFPVALAVVLDISGSMAGDKIEQAKSSVLQLVERMHDEDQVAIVVYNHDAQLIQALAPVGSSRAAIRSRIQWVTAGGGTMIPQALDLGAGALAGAPERLVRRVVLVSDGLDGSGLSADLVARSVRERASSGQSTSSLGIGSDYDERFLTSVADAGRGNYAFLAMGSELQAFLHRELEETSSTVVEQVAATLDLPGGWRLTRAYGAEAEGAEGLVRIPIGPMFAGDERRVVLDLTVNAGAPGDTGSMGVGVSYRTVADRVEHAIGGGRLALVAVPTESLAAATRDETVHATAEATVIDGAQQEALEAWRAGDTQRARSLTQMNSTRLQQLAAEAPAAAPALAPRLEEMAADDATFGAVSAGSEQGRAYGLRSNAARRERSRRQP